MNLLKRIITPFSIPFVVSVISHGIMLAGVSGTGVFDYLHSPGRTPVTAMLISGEPLQSSHISPYGAVPSIAGTEKESSRESDDPEAQFNTSDNPHEETSSLGKNIPSEYVGSSTIVSDLSVIPSLRHPITQALIPSLPPEDPSVPLVSGTAPPSFRPALMRESRPEILKHAREKLSFNLYWLDVYVGRAELDAINNKGKVTIRSQIHSASVISAFYKVEDDASSMVVNGIPVDFRIKQREGRYKSDKEIFFDPDRKHVTFFNYIKGTRDEHPLNGGDLWDLISGFYYLRTQLFEIGRNVYIDVFDSDKFYKAEVNVIGKERIKLSETKELDTIKVRPVLKSEGLFKNKGEILVWLTDDDNRTPVKIETKVPIGKVVAVLTSRETE